MKTTLKPSAVPDTAAPTLLHPSLKTFLDGARRYLHVALAFSFFTNLLVLTVPLYMLQVYDRVLTSRSVDTLLSLTLIATVALLALAVLDAARSHLVARIGYQLDLQTAADVLNASVKNALAKSRFPSVQGIRDIAVIRNLLNSSAATAVLDLPWLPIFLAVIFLLHSALGWLAVGGAILLLGVAMAGEITNRSRLDEASTQSLNLVQQAESGVRNADAFEAMGVTRPWINAWTNKNVELLQLSARGNDRNSSVLSVSRFFRMGLQVAVLGVGAHLVLQNELTPGAMIAAAILISRALAPVEQSIGAFKSLANAKTSFGKLKELLATLPAQRSSTPLPKPAGLLQVENLTYFHPGASEPCLYSINFALQPGESLGLIGPSGAGKTTLSRVLIGNLIPRLGHVRLDGMDMGQWDPEDRGKYLGYLPQHVELMSGTVFSNIARMQSADQEQVIRAAKLADVHDLIMRLPQGYDTDIGDQGSALSAGQRQRVALARALFGDVSFVLLDEPNAHLDHEGELRLSATLERLCHAGVTTVVVAHRPSVLQKVDKLLVLKEGRVASFGPREQIMKSVSQEQQAGQVGTVTDA